MKKSPPSSPPLKIEILLSLPLFENLAGGSTSPSREGGGVGGGAPCTLCTLNVFDDFRNKQKSLWSNVFLVCKTICILKVYSTTIHLDKTQMLKKFFSEKINIYNMLKDMAYLSKTECEIFHFQFRHVFIKVFIFVQQKAWNLCL